MTRSLGSYFIGLPFIVILLLPILGIILSGDFQKLAVYAYQTPFHLTYITPEPEILQLPKRISPPPSTMHHSPL